jgi:cysteine synthase
LVCGGRYFDDEKLLDQKLFWVIENFGKPSRIVTGAASGADTLAIRWAKKFNIENVNYPAEWRKYGKAAGPFRNSEMLRREQPEVVLAMPGGRGTLDMVRKAEKFGAVVVVVVDDSGEQYLINAATDKR